MNNKHKAKVQSYKVSDWVKPSVQIGTKLNPTTKEYDIDISFTEDATQDGVYWSLLNEYAMSWKMFDEWRTSETNKFKKERMRMKHVEKIKKHIKIQ